MQRTVLKKGIRYREAAYTQRKVLMRSMQVQRSSLYAAHNAEGGCRCREADYTQRTVLEGPGRCREAYYTKRTVIKKGMHVQGCSLYAAHSAQGGM